MSAEIVAAARRHVGTAFHHQARTPGVGMDCAGLGELVGHELRRLPGGFTVKGYSRNPDGRLLGLLDSVMDRIDRSEMRAGDVVCVEFDTEPQHVGILADYRHGGFSIIHASSKHGRVVETRLMFTPRMRFVAAFRFREAQAWPR